MTADALPLPFEKNLPPRRRLAGRAALPAVRVGRVVERREEGDDRPDVLGRRPRAAQRVDQRLFHRAAQVFLPSGLSPYRDAIVFALLIAFLLLRPNGLLRATQEVKL